MSGFDLDRLGGRAALEQLQGEVLRVGALALTHFEKGVRVDTKPDRSPVTAADREVERELRAFIQRTFPSAAFFGEETGREESEGAELRFVVDPIDGTRAFVRGMPTWSVLVGIEWQNEPVVGIAYMPASEDFFVGVLGDGARHNGKRLEVSNVPALQDAMVVHGALQQFRDAGLTQGLGALADASDSCRGFADFDGYKQVLLGRADAMIDPGVQPYDICPAAVLVREAGGRFTSIGGEPTVYGGSGLASNGLVHEQLVNLLQSTSSKDPP